MLVYGVIYLREYCCYSMMFYVFKTLYLWLLPFFPHALYIFKSWLPYRPTQGSKQNVTYFNDHFSSDHKDSKFKKMYSLPNVRCFVMELWAKIWKGHWPYKYKFGTKSAPAQIMPRFQKERFSIEGYHSWCYIIASNVNSYFHVNFNLLTYVSARNFLTKHRT